MSKFIDQAAVDFLFELAHDSDKNVLENTIGSFLKNSVHRVVEMRGFLMAGKTEDLEQAAHKFKSSCGVVGAILALESCDRIEDLCMNKGSVADMTREMNDLEANVTGAVDVLSQLYKQVA